MKHKLTLVALMALLAMVACNPRPKVATYLDPNAPVEERVEDALARMTIEEKIAIIHAQSKFSSPGVRRLGIHELWCTDGPHGIRPDVFWDEWDQAGCTNDSCVAYPALTALAATWNRQASALYGKSIGEEARYREKDVLLGPGVNIYRSPLNGRNFEYMGEDPYLAAQMVVPYVQEVQKNGVAACVKHYALNNQETYRHHTEPVLDDRALYEIYLPAFKAAVVEGGSWSIMGAYNYFEGQHACHNDRLLNQILKQEWGFDGAVISDWGGAHNTEEAIHNGLDLEFGTWTNGLTQGYTNAYDSYYLAQPYLKQIREGKVGTEELDDKARRVLRLIFRTAMNTNKPYGSLVSEAHIEAARQIGEEGVVLLKNDNHTLPIDLSTKPRIAVVGENAIKMMTVGGGSSSLKVAAEVSPLDGLRKAVGESGEVLYARGYVGDVNTQYNGVVAAQDLHDDRSEDELIAEAVALAKECDWVVMFGGLNKASHQDCENSDRFGLELPYAQNRLIEALAAVNDKFVFVNISGNAVAMPWVESVPAIVQGWYLGSEAGNSLANVLVGSVSPSGKLPFTFPVRLEDCGAHSVGEYGGKGKVHYAEGILVGYRWHETKNIAPLFAFGHGLSYTTFEYTNASLSSKSIREGGRVWAEVTVTNSGDRDGAEVVQLYVGDNEASVLRPAKELKGFQKVWLRAGESKRVKIEVPYEALCFFDDKAHAWRAEKGAFTISLGSASDDIRATLPLRLR
ncbi:MAG: glycoside hydrolase family 3 C-terminal domain-containing protein [Tidjanibacter sp.]|nr:glycoside hydrolase family 3 C-terminal domain-containing protein [Tidjanibacter sp.]